jgi:hypothetical protein
MPQLEKEIYWARLTSRLLRLLPSIEACINRLILPIHQFEVWKTCFISFRHLSGRGVPSRRFPGRRKASCVGAGGLFFLSLHTSLLCPFICPLLRGHCQSKAKTNSLLRLQPVLRCHQLLQARSSSRCCDLIIISELNMVINRHLFRCSVLLNQSGITGRQRRDLDDNGRYRVSSP